jgi:hypothetical protein
MVSFSKITKKHNLGILFITVAFIYLLYITVVKHSSPLPPVFCFLYGIGGVILFSEMMDEKKTFVYACELIGFIIAFFLGFQSIFYFNRNNL